MKQFTQHLFAFCRDDFFYFTTLNDLVEITRPPPARVPVSAFPTSAICREFERAILCCVGRQATDLCWHHQLRFQPHQVIAVRPPDVATTVGKTLEHARRNLVRRRAPSRGGPRTVTYANAPQYSLRFRDPPPHPAVAGGVDFFVRSRPNLATVLQHAIDPGWLRYCGSPDSNRIFYRHFGITSENARLFLRGRSVNHSFQSLARCWFDRRDRSATLLNEPRFYFLRVFQRLGGSPSALASTNRLFLDFLIGVWEDRLCRASLPSAEPVFCPSIFFEDSTVATAFVSHRDAPAVSS